MPLNIQGTQRPPEREPLYALSTATADRAASEGCFGFQGSLSLVPLPEPPLLLPSAGLPVATGMVSLGLGPWDSQCNGLMGRRLAKRANGMRSECCKWSRAMVLLQPSCLLILPPISALDQSCQISTHPTVLGLKALPNSIPTKDL